MPCFQLDLAARFLFRHCNANRLGLVVEEEISYERTWPIRHDGGVKGIEINSIWAWSCPRLEDHN